jgi:hypothetical protein
MNGAAEVVLVLRFVEPALLALAFAGQLARGFGAELLAAKVASVRNKNLFTA